MEKRFLNNLAVFMAVLFIMSALFVTTGCDNPAAARDAEDPSLNIAGGSAPDGTLASPVPRALVTAEGLYVGEEYLSPIALDDQTGDNVIDKALAYINAQTLTETTNYTILLGGGSYVIPGRLSGDPDNITAENAIITLVGISSTEISASSRKGIFRIGAGTLVLDNNITLKGHNDAQGSSLVFIVPPHATSTLAALVIKDGAKITGNSHGGVTVYSGGSLVMEGGEISGNTDNSEGGGVYIWGGSLVMNGGEISGNTARYGGGVYTQGKSSVTLRGGKISGNKGGIGGGILVGTDTVFVMEGGEISGNTATGYGGGVFKYAGEVFSKTGGRIYGNTAEKEKIGANVYYLAATHYGYYYDGDLGEEDTVSADDILKWSRDNVPWL